MLRKFKNLVLEFIGRKDSRNTFLTSPVGIFLMLWALIACAAASANVIGLEEGKIAMLTRDMVGTYVLNDLYSGQTLTAVVTVEHERLTFAYARNRLVQYEYIPLARAFFQPREISIVTETATFRRRVVEQSTFRFEKGRYVFTKTRDLFKRALGLFGWIYDDSAYSDRLAMRWEMKKTSNQPLSDRALQEIADRQPGKYEPAPEAAARAQVASVHEATRGPKAGALLDLAAYRARRCELLFK